MSAAFTPGLTDEQLRAAFTLDSGGPNPFYRCNKCGQLVPGLPEYLAAHWHRGPEPAVDPLAIALEALEVIEVADLVKDVYVLDKQDMAVVLMALKALRAAKAQGSQA